LEPLEDRTVPSGLLGNLVVFGDSSSDTGNAAIATGGAIPNPALYYQGRFSNGPIWVDALAQELGEPSVRPSLAGGLDYAFGGATVAFQNQPPPFNMFPRVSQQVDQYLAHHHSAGDDLLVIWGGANDFFESFPSPTGPINPTLSADTLVTSLEALVQRGGREFIVPNLAPLGETPFIRGLGIPGLSAVGDQWAAAFDAELAADVGNFKSKHPGAVVVSLDVAALFQLVTQPSNPFGFVNTTDPVGPLVPGSPFLATVTASDPQDYLFYDGVHPTSKAHVLVGMEAAAEMLNALPIHHLIDSREQVGALGAPANVGTTAADSFGNLASGLGSMGPLVVAGRHSASSDYFDRVAGFIKPSTRIAAIAAGDELSAWDIAEDAFEVF
jgi:phospholipase/lecithinase/hemolysin